MSGDSTPTSISIPLPKFTKVLVGVDPPTISNVLTCSCGVVVCVHTHNNTNSFSFIAASVCGGGGMGCGWGFGGKEWCGVGFTTHPHTLLFSYSFLFYLMWWVVRFAAHPPPFTFFESDLLLKLRIGRSPFQIFYLFVINKLEV